MKVDGASGQHNLFTDEVIPFKKNILGQKITYRIRT